jgi:hypothetical protein
MEYIVGGIVIVALIAAALHGIRRLPGALRRW